MISSENYVLVAYTRKPHGLQGELGLKVEAAYLEDVLRASVIFIRLQGREVPYFVEQLRVTDKPLLKLEDVDNREAAQTLVAKEVYLRESDLIPEAERELEAEELDYAFLTGYRIEDATKGIIGTIEEVVELPQQEMAVLQYEGRELLIPLNDQLILDIQEEQQLVKMELPAGLLEL